MLDQASIPKMSVSRGALLGMATHSAFRWSPIGEVTESLTLSSRSMDEFYPELRVHLDRPPETIDCVGRAIDCPYVGSPQCSRSPNGRNASTANTCTTKQDKVKVYVRMRPFSESEKVCPLKQVLCLIGETIVVRDLDQKSKEHPHKGEAIEFKVDYMQDDSYLQVHSEIHKEESQKRMYGALGVPCIESALDGYNTTILAYGQTGSGKTYTMMGDNTKAGRGLIPRLANDLMTKINEEISNGVLYTVQVSYLEIYQEKIRDLLAEDEVEEESKTASISQTVLDSSGMKSNEKVRPRGSNPEMKFGISGNNLDERVMHSYAGSLTENSYTSSFLNKAALQRQLEASQRHSKVKSDGEKSLEKPFYSSTHDGVANKVRSPKTKPAFDTVFNKQKIHKHYRTFPTVLEEAPPLRKQNFLKIREHPITGPFVEGLLWKDVCTWYDMETLMKQGSISRTTAATDMNEQSSRSHAVFSIRLKKVSNSNLGGGGVLETPDSIRSVGKHLLCIFYAERQDLNGSKKLGPDLFGVHPSSVSYINLVDLAGSEKLPKLCSGAVTGQRTQEESRCINRSLSQLNEVILSLSKSSFVSYRNSVLTWLLKESLGGNSRTFMVANISPTEKDLRESINTLRYATTASRIPPPVALDQDPRNKLIKTLKEEISTLRTLLSSFTTVKENAASDQLPSLQGFKVACLDVGLQVERNRFDRDGSCGKKLHQHLDKGSQTENHVRDNGQQTTSRSGSGDAGFQIAIKDSGALDMGNPTVLQDSGRVDFGHQTLILNVCACDSAHQAFAKDFGVMDVGIQVALKELGIVTLSQESTLRNCFVEDVCFQSTRQGCGSVYLGHQTPSRDCGAVNVGNEVASRDWGDGNVGNQLPMQNWEGVGSWNRGGDIDDRIWDTLQNKDRVTLPDREDVDAANQIKMQNSGGIYCGNHITSPNWASIDAGNQIVYRDSGNVDVGHQITLRNWGDVQAKNQISSTDWSPVDLGLQTSCIELAGIDIGSQITAKDWGLSDAKQTNPTDYGSKDAGNQTRLQDHDVNKAANCTVVQLDVSHQIDWREFGASDAGLQVTFNKPLTMDAGYQVSLVDFGGTSDNGNQTKWRDFGTSDVGHQVTVDDKGPHWNPHNLNDCNVLDDLHSSRTHDNSSTMISKEPFTSAVVNPNNGFWRRSAGAVDVGHPSVLANLGAIDVSYEAGLRVGLVEERKEQFERKSLSDVRRGQDRTLLKFPGISAVQQASLKRIGAVSIKQTSLKVRAGEDKESQSDWNYLAADVGYQPTLQNCGRAIDIQLQTNLKTLRTLDVGIQTKWDSIGVRASQTGSDANFKNYQPVDVRHQSTSTEFFSLEVNCNNLNTYRDVEAWQFFRSRVCGASQDNSMLIVPTMVPIKVVAANVGLRTSSIDFYAMASELQTPTTGCWGVSSDADPITPKILEAIANGSEVDREEGLPCHEQHQGCWKLPGASDINSTFCRACKASNSLDLEDRGRPSVYLGDVHGGRPNHSEECKIPNSGYQNCEQDYLARQWQYQARQVVRKDSVVHNWLHHHEITLSEPSYLVTERVVDILNTDEEASWNASRGSKHQNPQGYRYRVTGMEVLQDVKLKQVGASNVGGLLQCTHCRVVESGVQAFPRDIAMVQVGQQPGSGELEGIDQIIEERFDSVIGKTRFFKERDGELIDGIPQTEAIEEGRHLESDSSHKTHQQRYRFSMPGQGLEVHGECENGQCPDGKLVRNQNSDCLSWLHDLTGQKKRCGNVPAEEAFHLCSLWTLANLRNRMEWYSIRSQRDCLKYRLSLATNCRGLVSQPQQDSKTEVATQTASGPENSTNHETDPSNALQLICLLWVFIILRIAAPDKMSALEGKRPAGKRPPFQALATPGKIRILSYLSDSAIDDRHFASRRYNRTSRLRHLRYSGVERLIFQNTTPFFIQTSGSCSLLKTRVERSPRPGTTAAGSRSYKIMCGFPSRRAVHFLKEGVNRLGSNVGAHIIVNGLSDDHTEFIYMPAHRCVQEKGYVVARLVSPGAMAFLNGQPMLEHKELCTGDVLVLRDLRYWSSVCTLHFFDLVKMF